MKTASARAVLSLRERCKMLNERVTELERAVGHLQATVLQNPTDEMPGMTEVLEEELIEA